MSILDNIRAAGSALLGKPQKIEPGVAYGNMWPNWETQSPQYPMPNAYNLAQLGYRKDELVYACIDYRAQTLSEPPAMLWKGKGKDKEPVAGLFDNFPRGQPNAEMSEAEFWMVSEIYRLIAGAAIWEIETNRMGEPINLWPLNPAYCSFRRGNNRPLDKVVYLYPGLNPVDIPREKCVIFMEFDPLYPMLKGLSKTAVAMRSIGVHSSTTDFLNIFFQRGAIIQGYLKFAQSLNDAEADRAKKRWRDSHGGAGNWGENNIGVLGQGAEFVKLQMDFKEMAFSAVDGRTESLITMVFGVSPLLIEASVGLGAVTDTNFVNVEKKFYNRVAKPSWRWYSGEMTQQLVPLITDDPAVYCAHDITDVAALREDENALWARVDTAAKSNLIYRDEGRSMLHLEPVDNGEKVFLGVTLQGGQAPAESARIADPEWIEEETPEPEPQMVTPSPFTTTTTGAPTFSEPTVTDETQLKAWRALSLTTSAPIGTPWDAELALCKTNTQKRAVFEAHWPTKKPELDPVLELKRFNDYVERKG